MSFVRSFVFSPRALFRALCAGALALCATPVFCADDIRTLSARLAGTDKPAAIAAIRELGVRQDAPAVAVLAARLPRETDNYLKVQIIESLSISQSTAAASALRAALRDGNPAVRQAALTALAAVDPRGTDTLESVARTDPQPAVRQAAVNALGVVRSTAAAAALERVAADPKADARARGYARKSIADHAPRKNAGRTPPQGRKNRR